MWSSTLRSLCEVRSYVERRGLSPGFPRKKRPRAAHNSLCAWEPLSSSHHPRDPPKRLLHAFSGRFSSVVARTARGEETRDVATARPNYAKLFHGIIPAKSTNTGTFGSLRGAASHNSELHITTAFPRTPRCFPVCSRCPVCIGKRSQPIATEFQDFPV